jgi:acid phosphatase type 7
VDVSVWLAVILSSLMPVHVTRGPVVTQATQTGAHVAFLTDRAVAGDVRIDGRDVRGPVTKDHRIVVSGLQPGRRYPYQLIAGGRQIGDGSFRTDPGPGGSFRAVVFGDYGEGTTAEHGVVRLTSGWHPDVLVSTGDNVYLFAAGGFLLDPNMFRPLEPLLEQAVFVPALGNHDTFLDGGRTLLGALDLTGALQQTRDACFRVAVFHHPPFNPHSGGIAAALDRTVVPRLQRGGVQLTLLGHVHDYERSYARKGVTYVVVGTGGAAIGRYPVSSIPLARHLIGTFGALRLDVAPHRIQATFADVAGHIRDRFGVAC